MLDAAKKKARRDFDIWMRGNSFSLRCILSDLEGAYLYYNICLREHYHRIREANGDDSCAMAMKYECPLLGQQDAATSDMATAKSTRRKLLERTQLRMTVTSLRGREAGNSVRKSNL